MNHNHQNRHHKRPPPSHRPEPVTKSIPQSAYISAYEAQLVYGQDGRAEELYQRGGRGLMQWQGGEEGEEVWADRHDIIHLLSDLPGPSMISATRAPPSPGASSSSSWESLPSDLEETFHLSDPVEIAEYEREKRVRQIASLREARLKEREDQDQQDAAVQEELDAKTAWPEAEIPPHATLTLMTHTATSLLSSPNSKILESRILLNHAKDERFEFLKGRWKLTWERVKKDAKAKKEVLSGKGEREVKSVGTLIGGYASSDEEEEADEDGEVPPPPPEAELPPAPNEGEDRGGPTPSPPTPLASTAPAEGEEIPQTDDLEEKKRARRLKAEEWKRQRALKQA